MAPRVSDGAPFNKRPQGRPTQRRSWLTGLEEVRGRGRSAECRESTQGTCLYEGLWGSGLMETGPLKPKRAGLVNSPVVLSTSKGLTAAAKPYAAGETVTPRGSWGSLIQDLHGLRISGLHLNDGAESTYGPRRPFGGTEWTLRQNSMK